MGRRGHTAGTGAEAFYGVRGGIARRTYATSQATVRVRMDDQGIDVRNLVSTSWRTSWTDVEHVLLQPGARGSRVAVVTTAGIGRSLGELPDAASFVAEAQAVLAARRVGRTAHPPPLLQVPDPVELGRAGALVGIGAGLMAAAVVLGFGLSAVSQGPELPIVVSFAAVVCWGVGRQHPRGWLRVDAHSIRSRTRTAQHEIPTAGVRRIALVQPVTADSRRGRDRTDASTALTTVVAIGDTGVRWLPVPDLGLDEERALLLARRLDEVRRFGQGEPVLAPVDGEEAPAPLAGTGPCDRRWWRRFAPVTVPAPERRRLLASIGAMAIGLLLAFGLVSGLVAAGMVRAVEARSRVVNGQLTAMAPPNTSGRQGIVTYITPTGVGEVVVALDGTDARTFPIRYDTDEPERAWLDGLDPPGAFPGWLVLISIGVGALTGGLVARWSLWQEAGRRAADMVPVPAATIS